VSFVTSWFKIFFYYVSYGAAQMPTSFQQASLGIWIGLVAISTSWASAADVLDRIRTTRGSELGEVTDMTTLEIRYNKKPAGAATVAVNEIRSISFQGEPGELTQARNKMASGGFAEASDLLVKINVATIERNFIKQDVEFYQALSAAKLALGGRGTINDAGRLLNAFVRANPQNFHYYEAVEIMGDLLAADGKFDLAQKQYNDLAKAPWPEYKMRGAVALGHAFQAQGKHAEAIAQFESALGLAGADAKAQSEKLPATLGKAVSLAETGQLDTAVGMIEKVIQDANPEQKELHARAYNALGSCYQRAGQDKDALLAYLHVDVLYNTVPEAHAEALANLATLWQAVGQEARAREARQILQERYAGSRWAK
jgi:tetratricopeptide (TPR) repeat protein